MIVLAMGCMGHVTSMGVKNETTMMHDSEFSLATRAVLPWSIAFPEGIIASEINPNASMFVTEGPQVRIMRSSVQLFASPSGVVGIAANGIHQNQRQMVDLTGKPVWINTAEPPLAALRLRDSSIVTASESEISRIAPNGGETRLVQGFYSLLCDAGEGHFWTADYQKGLAQYRDGAGKLVSQYPLKTAPGMVSDAKGRLCYVGASDSALSCLDVHGVRTREEGFTLEPWSTIVGYGDETLLTDVGGGIQFQVQHKSPKYLPIVSGGLTHDDQPFISGFADQKTSVKIGNAPTQWLTIPQKYLGSKLPMYVVAVDAQHYWVTGEKWCILFDHKGIVVEDFEQTEESYEKRLFPKLWTVTGKAAIGGKRLLISCSGPSGVAVLELGF